METNRIKNSIFEKLCKKGFVVLSKLFKKNKMQEDLINTERNKEFSEEEILIQSLKDAKNEWLNADRNFQYVSEDEFVEYYTYKLKAAQIKYEFFLRKVKEKGIRINIGSGIIEKNAHNNEIGKKINTNDELNAYINSGSTNTNTTSITSNSNK